MDCRQTNTSTHHPPGADLLTDSQSPNLDSLCHVHTTLLIDYSRVQQGSLVWGYRIVARIANNYSRVQQGSPVWGYRIVARIANNYSRVQQGSLVWGYRIVARIANN